MFLPPKNESINPRYNKSVTFDRFFSTIELISLDVTNIKIKAHNIQPNWLADRLKIRMVSDSI